MAIELRECAGIAQFNTGSSKCLLDPGKVKAIILTMHGYKHRQMRLLNYWRLLVTMIDQIESFRLKPLLNTHLLAVKRIKTLSVTVQIKSLRIQQKMMCGLSMNMTPV